MFEKTTYRPDFYNQMDKNSQMSVQVILDVLFKTVPSPKSVIDVGAGVGSWVKALTMHGCKRVIAVEGEWVKNAHLQVPLDVYHLHNLEKPLRMAEKFDLAISLEVAEHLSERRALSFIEDLTLLADIVLFSAAIPGQGGTRHINEQWQQYWVDLFRERRFECFDIIRPHIWDDDRVRFEYRQNMLVFVRQNVAENLGLLRTSPLIASVIHPHIARNWGPGIKIAWKFLWKAIMRRMRK